MQKLSEIKKERINELRFYKAFATKVLNENKELNKIQKNTWKNQTVESNIKKLKELIADINKNLKDEDRIEKYCQMKSGNRNHFAEISRQTNGLIIYEISSYSISGSILYDINWLSHFTAGERIEISMGIKGPEILEKYWDVIVADFNKRIVPEFKKSHCFIEHAKLIEESIKIANNNAFIASNIILFSVTESLVRILARKLYHAQNPLISENDVQKIIDNSQSLETLLKKVPWENDIEVKTVEVVTKYSYVPEKEVKQAEEIFLKHQNNNRLFKKTLREVSSISPEDIRNKSDSAIKGVSTTIIGTLNEMDKLCKDIIDIKEHTTKINLRIRLHFLIRRYKEDRNNMIHGKYEGFNYKWKNYIFLSAIEKVYDVIKEYEKIYNIKF